MEGGHLGTSKCRLLCGFVKMKLRQGNIACGEMRGGGGGGVYAIGLKW